MRRKGPRWFVAQWDSKPSFVTVRTGVPMSKMPALFTRAWIGRPCLAHILQKARTLSRWETSADSAREIAQYSCV